MSESSSFGCRPWNAIIISMESIQLLYAQESIQLEKNAQLAQVPHSTWRMHHYINASKATNCRKSKPCVRKLRRHQSIQKIHIPAEKVERSKQTMHACVWGFGRVNPNLINKVTNCQPTNAHVFFFPRTATRRVRSSVKKPALQLQSKFLEPIFS